MRMWKCIWALVVSVVVFSALPDAVAQRRVTPVKGASQGLQGKNENKSSTDSIDYSKLFRSTDEKGNVVFVDTITGREIPDTAKAAEAKKPKMKRSLFHATAFGVDIWDPVMRIFGQDYGLIEFFGELNLHNRYIPVVEIGLGQAKHTPEQNNYTYKVPLTPYFRIGCNYNFMYNGNPDYMLFGGVRFGWSHFNYEVTEVHLNGGYWGDGDVVNFPKQTSNVTYMQLLLGIRVRIIGSVSLGWNFRYKFKLHETGNPNGLPWYIPGYGSRNGAVTGSFVITYTLPLSKDKTDEDPLIESGS